ncbi:MAG: hypothetical protein H0T47_17840 [Planctomycetaceae bacterium]|nr:hypothetical protein [Planctomycetaceae bacterium]
MRQRIQSTHATTRGGQPAGGRTTGPGLSIEWQDGPLVDPATGSYREPNGCFPETAIEAVLDRLQFVQGTGTAGDSNDRAIDHLNLAVAALRRGPRQNGPWRSSVDRADADSVRDGPS